MRLYLDDDSVGGELRKRLGEAGHDVHVPPGSGRDVVSDPVHLAAAIRAGRMILTRNYKDFAELHDLIAAAGGHHPGILSVRQDNDRRDMRPHQIVAAITNLESSGVEFLSQLHILNHYR